MALSMEVIEFLLNLVNLLFGDFAEVSSLGELLADEVQNYMINSRESCA